jgi:UDP-MurNAc hydroxylase
MNADLNADFTYWGHNCFLVETESEALLIDPWLNDSGAFFGSWHQWPPNGTLRENVRQRCKSKALSIYITHEHQDHFDTSTLSEFSGHPHCTVFIPAYRDKYLIHALTKMMFNTVELAEGQQAGSEIKLRAFIDDGGINHDSAIFVSTPDFSFFNQNDCKIFDRLPKLKDELGNIDYYTVQFSGATWYPACFDLPADQIRPLVRKKVINKFKNVLNGARIMSPKFLVPAAGPAFFPFLDRSLSMGTGTIFVHQDELDKYLRLNGIENILYPRPGDPIAKNTNRLPIAGPTANDIERYRSSHPDTWESIDDTFEKEKFADILQRRIDVIWDIELPQDTPSIAFCWGPSASDWLVVDLVNMKISESHEPASPYIIVRASSRYFSLMCQGERWQDIALSLRARVQRSPDVYNTIANIFLFADESSLRESLVQSLSVSKERIVLHHRGEKFEINRYCPHQGADLTHASIDDELNVVCPRHSWRFDLSCEGICKSSGTSIEAIRLG